MLIGLFEGPFIGEGAKTRVAYEVYQRLVAHWVYKVVVVLGHVVVDNSGGGHDGLHLLRFLLFTQLVMKRQVLLLVLGQERPQQVVSCDLLYYESFTWICIQSELILVQVLELIVIVHHQILTRELVVLLQQLQGDVIVRNPIILVQLRGVLLLLLHSNLLSLLLEDDAILLLLLLLLLLVAALLLS